MVAGEYWIALFRRGDVKLQEQCASVISVVCSDTVYPHFSMDRSSLHAQRDVLGKSWQSKVENIRQEGFDLSRKPFGNMFEERSVVPQWLATCANARWN